jgi:hypothetical protein
MDLKTLEQLDEALGLAIHHSCIAQQWLLTEQERPLGTDERNLLEVQKVCARTAVLRAVRILNREDTL